MIPLSVPMRVTSYRHIMCMIRYTYDVNRQTLFGHPQKELVSQLPLDMGLTRGSRSAPRLRIGAWSLRMKRIASGHTRGIKQWVLVKGDMNTRPSPRGIRNSLVYFRCATSTAFSVCSPLCRITRIITPFCYLDLIMITIIIIISYYLLPL